MRKSLFGCALAAVLLGAPCLAPAAPVNRSTVDDAIDVLDELAELPAARRLPPALLHEANAVVIIPDMVKGGFVVAGRHGRGVLLVRAADGGFTDPVFVTITGGSVGFQAGVQATDLVLVIRSRRSLDRLLNGRGKITLGADASVAVGPLGRQASADTDAQMRAEILSYSRSRGLFAGVALEGDTVRIDWAANERFYRKPDVTPADIVTGKVGGTEPMAFLRAKLARWPERVERAGPGVLMPPVAP